MKNIKNIQLQCKDFGYKETLEYIQGNITKEEMIDKIKMETRRYAKRQITWFKKDDKIVWLNGENTINENLNVILSKIKKI